MFTPCIFALLPAVTGYHTERVERKKVDPVTAGKGAKIHGVNIGVIIAYGPVQ